MKQFLVLGLALLLAGCHVQVDEPQVKPPAGSTVSNTDSKPAAPAPVASNASQAKPDDPSKKRGFNPLRVHQLDTLKKTKVAINGHTLDTWVMDNEELSQEGMMFVKDETVQPDQAMIFVFPDEAERSFWMHNTVMPLDIAYIGADKKVVRATTMKPMDETGVPSNGKAMYALEMKKGTIERLGIKKGTVVEIPADVKAQRG